MSVKRRSGFGGIRASLVASTSDVLAVQVSGQTHRVPTLLGASFLVSAPDPGQEAGRARLVLYSGGEPQQNALLPADGTPLEGGSFASRVWADLTIKYGEPFLAHVGGAVDVEPGDGLWAVLGCPIDGSGVAYDCIAALTLWGRE